MFTYYICFVEKFIVQIQRLEASKQVVSNIIGSYITSERTWFKTNIDSQNFNATSSYDYAKNEYSKTFESFSSVQHFTFCIIRLRRVKAAYRTKYLACLIWLDGRRVY